MSMVKGGVMVEEMKKPHVPQLGELLLNENLITRKQLIEAINFQKTNGGRLGSCVVRLGYVTENDITDVLSRLYGVPPIDLAYFELDAEITFLFDRRHGEHDRFGAQVRADERVRRVRVWRLDRLVSGREQTRTVPDLVPGSLVFGVRFIDPIGVLDAIIVHDREAVDIGLLGEGAGFRRTEAGLGVGCREMQCGENSNPTDKTSSCNFQDSGP